MLLYISATNQIVRVVLVVEGNMEGHKFNVQRHVYYVSKVLSICETRYPHYQNIAYVVFMASRSSGITFRNAQ